MSFAGLPFLVALLFVAATFFYLPGIWLRQCALALCNSIFLYFLIPNLATASILAVLLASGYSVGRLLQRWPSKPAFWLYLLALIAGFLAFKRYEILADYMPRSFLSLGVSIVGLSYMLFRQIQFLVDSLEGQVDRSSWWGFLNFQLNLFALLSGPIQRYQEFQSQWDRLDPLLEDDHAVRMAYLRLLIGILKMTILAGFFFSLYQQSVVALNVPLGTPQYAGRWVYGASLLGLLYCYPIYLYLNFSGYCDIAIASASFVGIRLPENFDRPYLSRNVIDYWTRWHRTLGFWIRDYVFVPLYRVVAQRLPGRAEQLAFLCYFVAFFLAGIWHGPTTNFIVYGLLQAVGVSAAKLWERHLIKGGGRKRLRDYLASSKIRWAAIIATLQFECASLLFFPTDITTTVRMLGTAWRALT